MCASLAGCYSQTSTSKRAVALSMGTAGVSSKDQIIGRGVAASFQDLRSLGQHFNVFTAFSLAGSFRDDQNSDSSLDLILVSVGGQWSPCATGMLSAFYLEGAPSIALVSRVPSDHWLTGTKLVDQGIGATLTVGWNFSRLGAAYFGVHASDTVIYFSDAQFRNLFALGLRVSTVL